MTNPEREPKSVLYLLNGAQQVGSISTHDGFVNGRGAEFWPVNVQLEWFRSGRFEFQHADFDPVLLLSAKYVRMTLSLADQENVWSAPQSQIDQTVKNMQFR